MPAIRFKNISKSYGTKVVRDFDAVVDDQEFLVLLGPSGCGKSTMLRMIAGLTEITDGELLFDGERMNDLEPRQRNVAFVFQSYALYPHMSVRGNIAFPLLMDNFRWWHHIPIVNGLARRAMMRRPEIRSKVEEVAETLELTPLLDRRPRAMSGGQRQRVALGRALVREPAIYLLDEPLSNLDAKLRTQMRAEISDLYRRVGKSFIYVTHDQVEAMTMGTKVIVMDNGLIQQYGTPEEIYDAPANIFVAKFIGSPPMNLLRGEVEAGTLALHGGSVVLPVSVPVPPGESVVGLRPEQITLSFPAEGEERAAGTRVKVRVVEHLGVETLVGFTTQLDWDPSTVGEASAGEMIYARLAGRHRVNAGDIGWAEMDLAAASWFDAETGLRLERGHDSTAWAGGTDAAGADGTRVRETAL